MCRRHASHGPSERKRPMTGSEHRCSRRRQRRSLAAAAGVAALAVALAACSSGSSSSSSSSGAANANATATAAATTSSCLAAANAFLKPWDSLPTSLSSAYTPLTSKPAPGGTVMQLVNGTIPSDGQSFQQLSIAAHTIGWTAKDIIFDGTVADLNAKFEQADLGQAHGDHAVWLAARGAGAAARRGQSRGHHSRPEQRVRPGQHLPRATPRTPTARQPPRRSARSTPTCSCGTRAARDRWRSSTCRSPSSRSPRTRSRPR